ncbi:DNA mismatch repair protein MutS [uncultured Faecalibaculum sp.]|uniref:DNA mismatch repair protein MutS n=1 Tax=uncultured Faecalibaculum sp. TaxID=1729681 RepID=UPI0025F59FB3|nr:DNA mismatch repair protein MutS [uncultured Faecalibaculum sp.]
MEKTKYTPMMNHYLSMKEQNPDAILFYRLGDFYEMFFEDAKTVSRELDLVLTGRAAGNGEKAPMCGVPFHAADNYIQRLVNKGYKVAVCEQLSDPAASKGLVDRDIVKIVTPGTILEETGSRREQYLAAVHADGWNLCVLYCELSTGELFYDIREKSLIALQKALKEKDIAEAVLSRSISRNWKQVLAEDGGLVLSESVTGELGDGEAGLVPPEPAVLSETLSLLFNYLEDTQKQKIRHLQKAQPLQQEKTMILDQETRRHLEITKSQSSAARAVSLWEFMDVCCTSMGSRLLARWLTQPLADRAGIEKRQEAVQTMTDQFLLRETLNEYLSSIYDMDRLAARIAYGSAGPRDVQQLGISLKQIPGLIEALKGVQSWPEWQLTPDCADLQTHIENALNDDIPLTLKDGGLFRDGYNSRLDELRRLSADGQSFILELEQKERERTGVKSLKIGYNRVFGYYIDVRKSNLGAIKEEFGYIPRQTLANSTRFTTAQLKEREDRILSANEERIALENQLFQELLQEVEAHLFEIHEAARTAAQADALLAMARQAVKYGYIRPAFHEGTSVRIEEGRHPILDTRLSSFVSNDWVMESDTDIQLITGPNMGGKSTWMRQNALLVIMAQAGSFIPARQAQLPVFDRIFTRMGAGDDLLTGTSTFMAEMMEANNALRYATDSSLILFDEIGRGTATYDGMALAQAILEYIESSIHARTLFSTHYHELTALEKTNPGIQNVHVDVKEKKDSIEFRYRIIPGKSDRSYGINVARLAHLPGSVTDRAVELLQDLEADTDNTRWQPSLFVTDRQRPEENRLLDRLDSLNVDEMTPREALDCLYELKKLRKKAQD